MKLSEMNFSSRYRLSRESANFDLNNTLYNTYLLSCKDHLDELALSDTRKKKDYTNRELIQMIENLAYSLSKMGIRENDKIGLVVDNGIEEAAFLFAANKIGALVKFIDFTKGIEFVKHSIEETDLSLLVLDDFFVQFSSLINEKRLPLVVTNAKDAKENLCFEELTMGSTQKRVASAPYHSGKPSVMINSSGTTGLPKVIVHSDYTINASAQKMLYTDFPLDRRNVMMKNIPPQIGLGLITSLYTPLISGMKVATIGESINHEQFINNIVNFVRNFPEFRTQKDLNDALLLTFTSPLFIKAFLFDPRVTDMSYFGGIMGAGSKMGKAEIEEMEKVGQTKGLTVPLNNAYGQNELGGAVATNTIKYNRNGSAGYPVYGTEVKVIDEHTLAELGPNQTGLIVDRANSHFLYYDNLPEETQKAKITLPDGEWFNTNDIGYYDTDGFIYITGRKARVAIRYDRKISLDDLEKKIESLSFVKQCATIMSKSEGSFEEIAAFVVPNGETGDDIEKLIKSSNVLSDFDMPSEIYPIGELPYLSSGKIDYQKLMEMYKDLNKTRKRSI